MKVVSFTTTFPRPDEPDLGLFVRRRLLRLAALADVTVIAPVAAMELGNPKRKFAPLSMIPKRRQDGPLEVLHPRFLHLPGLQAATAPLLAMFAYRALRRRIGAGAVDVLDAHFGFPSGIAAAMLSYWTGIPFVVTLRGNETMHAQSPAVRKQLSWMCRRAAFVIGVSSPLCEFARQLGADPARCRVIPNGVEADVFYPRERARCRQSIGMRPDALHILSAGYLIERKGHHHIVAALPGLRARGRSAELWIVGNPGRENSFRAGIEQAARDYGVAEYVHFQPAVTPDRLAEFMTAADVFCLASSREGWPNVVNEALACGAPVVASDVGGVPDMLPGDSYGYAVPAADTAALAEALFQALGRGWDRTEIARWGQSRSWEQVARETFEVLSAAAGTGKKEPA